MNNKKNKAFGLLVILCGLAMPWRGLAQVPANGLVLWLKADKGIITDSKGADSVWQDQSGKKNHAYQPKTTLRPAFISAGINGRPAVHFGGGTYLKAPSHFPVNSSYTVVSVFFAQNLNVFSNILSGNTSRYFWFNGSAYPGFGHSGDSIVNSYLPVPNNFCSVMAVTNDSSRRASIYVNGKPGASSTYIHSNIDSGINIGAFAGMNTFEGDMAEVLVFNRALNSTEMGALNTYLNNKYGMNLPADSDVVIKKFPAHLQFFQRGKNDSANVKIMGQVVKTGYDSVAVEVLKNNMLIRYISQPLTYKSSKASFSFQPSIHAELSEYSFRLHLIKRYQDSIVARETGIVCGDAYIFTGQSNIVAMTEGNTYINEFVRSFGSLTTYNTDTPDDTAWGYANGNYYFNKGISFVGGVGLQMAQNLMAKYKMPLCFINGAVGGSTIEDNLKNNYLPTDQTTIYGRLLYRMQKSGLDTAAKGIVWYHGADNSIDGYYANFDTLYHNWNRDYKNLKKIYVMQIHTGCNDIPHQALRELQRTLPDSLPGITSVSVNNVPGHNGCHFDYTGYDTIGNWLTLLFAKDFYGSNDSLNIKPLNIAKAWYTDTTDTVIHITFKEKNAGLSFTPDLKQFGIKYNIKSAFYLDDKNGLIKSVAVSGDTLILKLTSPYVYSHITYLPDHYYENTINCYEGPWIINKRGIGALAFYEFPLAVFPTLKTHFQTGTICLGQPFAFIDSSVLNAGHETSIRWDFGDGHNSGISSASHTYTKAGTYNVTLRVQTSTGLKDSLSKSFKVLPTPDARFTYDNTTAQYVIFKAVDTVHTTGQWNFGDGGAAKGIYVPHNYSAYGTYEVRFTIISQDGCQAINTDTLLLYPKLKAAFSFNNNICLGGVSTFRDSSSVSNGTITAWNWNFGDYNTSTDQSPTHVYKTPGYYWVSLKVTDSYGTKTTATKLVTIFEVPDAKFTTYTTPGTREVWFKPEAAVWGQFYDWKFGDGDSSWYGMPEHTYVKDSNYKVSLKVSNGACGQTYTAAVVVNPSLSKPKANFSHNGTCQGSNTIFKDLSTGQIDSVVQWVWTFGDGKSTTTQNPVHLYSQPGTYSVTLKVTDRYGLKDSTAQNIVIHALPNADFGANAQGAEMVLVPGDTMLANYTWFFGDSSTSGNMFGNHTYAHTGTYTVRLQVSDTNGCANQSSQTIDVASAGVATNSNGISPALNIFPNPFVGQTQISFYTPVAADMVTLSIYDQTGHYLTQYTEGGQPQGTRTYTLDATALHLLPGMYVLKLTADGYQVQKEVVVR